MKTGLPDPQGGSWVDPQGGTRVDADQCLWRDGHEPTVCKDNQEIAENPDPSDLDTHKTAIEHYKDQEQQVGNQKQDLL